jgi:hypothetical protein
MVWSDCILDTFTIFRQPMTAGQCRSQKSIQVIPYSFSSLLLCFEDDFPRLQLYTPPSISAIQWFGVFLIYVVHLILPNFVFSKIIRGTKGLPLEPYVWRQHSSVNSSPRQRRCRAVSRWRALPVLPKALLLPTRRPLLASPVAADIIINLFVLDQV